MQIEQIVHTKPEFWAKMLDRLGKCKSSGRGKMAGERQLLQEVETFTENIGDTIRDPLLILDRDLIVKWANRSFYKTFQATLETTVGQHLYNLGNGEWQIPTLLKALGEIIPNYSHFDDFEVEHDFPRIGRKVMLLNARKVYRPGNRTVMLALAIEDITERRRAEAVLAVAQQRDRRIAAALQRPLLFRPSEDAFPGLGVRIFYETSGDEAVVGGDFWDVFAFDDGKVALVVGDVMGKGLAAAVFTSEIRFTLRGFVYEHKQPGRALRQINSYLCESHRLYYEGLNDQGDDAPVCLVLAVIEAATGHGIVSAAGMASPMLIRAKDQMAEIDATGLPLGAFADAHYDEVAFELGSGDTLLLTTDGIIEARREDEFLDTDGLKRLAREGMAKGTLEALGRTILDGAHAFAGGHLQDDACLLLVQRK